MTKALVLRPSVFFHFLGLFSYDPSFVKLCRHIILKTKRDS
jgi:hypothetical protein